jgi:membrane protease YdiL (CAAX protease family)
MNLASVFLNPQTKVVRSGWRALIFLALSPQLLLPFLTSGSSPQAGAALNINISLVFSYGVLLGWVLLISFACLHLLDRLPLSSLGLARRSGWWRELLMGCTIGALMITLVVLLQAIGGGTQVTPNPIWWRSGAIDDAGLLIVVGETSAALLLLMLAGAFEEVVYRGYPFQTLLRGAPAIVPILCFALLFGIAHWDNPNRTFFSTVNTALAGVWLSTAYLKTRSLWLPISLHFSWNWMMGAFFGLPVSGLMIPRHPILLSTSEGPIWLTGGGYGCEGGVAVTIALILTTIYIWRAKWPSVSPETPAALSAEDAGR